MRRQRVHRDQLALFDTDESGGATVVKGNKFQPVWSSLHGVARRTMCDQCVFVLRDQPHTAPLPKRATYRRILDDTTVCLCSQHAQDQRERDALTSTTKGN